MKKGASLFILLLSTVFAVYLLAVGFPRFVTEQQQSLSQKQNQGASFVVATQGGEPELSQELLDHIKKQRETAPSESDQFYDMADKIGHFDSLYNVDAERILADKFKAFFAQDLNFNPEGVFQVPNDLKPNVQFWIQIFGVYDRNTIIFYDMQDVGIVFSVLDFSDMSDQKNAIAESIQRQMVAQEQKRIKNMITKIAKFIPKDKLDKNDLKDLTEEEWRLLNLYHERKDHIDTDEKTLLKSLSYRTGFAQRIRTALADSGKYLPEMQRIFKARGLPEELTLLPFIESAFRLDAYSHAGAAGMWQFIAETGKRYLRIDEYVDERYDPILATYAAASHLTHEYKFLNSWPMTVNAYNTGPGRMRDAEQKLGTSDIAEIVKKYKGSGYGFDSRNYYPEFLAMVYVYTNRDHYFGVVEPDPVERYEYIVMPATTDLKSLARLADTRLAVLRELNPALKPQVLSGEVALPKGYLIKVPPEQKDNLLLAAKEIYMNKDFASYHVVKRGEDLDTIAYQYDIEPKDLVVLNRLLSGQKLKKGEVLKLPVEKFETNLAFIKDGERQDLEITNPED